MIPIFIPTKGRVNNQKTAELLQKTGIEYKLVVEPQEKHLYKGHNIVVLPENDKGLAYSRNHILSLNRGLFGMFDDDVRDFGIVENKRCKSVPEKLIDFIGLCEKHKGFATYCPNYRQYACSARKSYSVNIQSEVISVIDASLTGNARYDGDVFPDDRDFFLQLIVHGRKTVCFGKYWFSCPHVGKSNGGLHNMYMSGECEQGIMKLKQKWGEFIKVSRRPYNTINASVNRSKLKQSGIL
ncbi:MAG: hypothetical protein LBL18_03365 [Bacteroidales bacterium]|jgi:hypothetical protein|nr:hypothetical protein [Bacteroidales bacterium]